MRSLIFGTLSRNLLVILAMVLFCFPVDARILKKFKHVDSNIPLETESTEFEIEGHAADLPDEVDRNPVELMVAQIQKGDPKNLGYMTMLDLVLLYDFLDDHLKGNGLLTAAINEFVVNGRKSLSPLNKAIKEAGGKGPPPVFQPQSFQEVIGQIQRGEKAGAYILTPALKEAVRCELRLMHEHVKGQVKDSPAVQEISLRIAEVLDGQVVPDFVYVVLFQQTLDVVADLKVGAVRPLMATKVGKDTLAATQAFSSGKKSR